MQPHCGKRLPSLLLGAMIGFAAMQGMAHEAAPEHVYVVGEFWGFDIVVNGTSYRNRETIVRIADGDIEIRTFSLKGEVFRKFSPAMNPRDETDKEILQVKLPLAVGNTWEYEFTERMLLNGDRVHNTRKAKVAATERIRVTAGEFDCYRIEANGFYTNLSIASPVGNNGAVRETFWYAPAVGRVIRHEARSTMWGAGSTAVALEATVQLRRYEPGAR